MFLCRLYGIYFNIRHIKHGLLDGVYLLGHDFKYTGEVSKDYWIMACKRCDIRAACDTGPKSKKKA